MKHVLLSKCVLIFMFNSVLGRSTVIKSKPNTVYKYFQQVQGESGLRDCSPREVCSIVHKRFWMPTLSERMCRCPNGIECPWQWQDIPNNDSIALDNRSQLKFCEPIIELKLCNHYEEAVDVVSVRKVKKSRIMPLNVTVNCICPETHYWKLQKFSYEKRHVFQTFTCAKQRMCDSKEFCGYVRADIFSVYYKCSCPQRHMCIFKSRKKENVQELLYTGGAHRAICDPL